MFKFRVQCAKAGLGFQRDKLLPNPGGVPAAGTLGSKAGSRGREDLGPRVFAAWREAGRERLSLPEPSDCRH